MPLRSLLVTPRRGKRVNVAHGDARRNRAAWDAGSDDYQREHGRGIAGDKALAWGLWRIPERELNVLGDVRGRDILELGSGAAQWSIALAAKGARPVALDVSHRQLAHARKAAARRRRRVPVVEAAAESLPFRDGSFDVVFCDYGGMSFADPALTVPEAGRVLRPDGLLAFSTTTPFLFVCWPSDSHSVTRTLRKSYFGMRRGPWPDGTVDYQLPYGEWIRTFVRSGFVIEDLIEVRPPHGARTSFPGRPLSWARRWPAEMIWKVRNAPHP